MAPVSVASASVTNGITGAGYYKGPGADRQGNFTPATAAAGNHTIWYIYEANNGCTDSAAATVFVHPAPLASFTTASGICPGQKLTFTDGSTINTNADPGASIKTWTWNFDDGTPDVINSNGNTFERAPAAVKIAYNISLKAISNEGCESELFTKKVTAHLLPDVSFELPAVICMPGGEAAFVNKSTTTEPGVLTYNWQFGDGAVSAETNPSHVYTAAQPYPVTLKATSAFGCTATATQSINNNSFKEKPVAAFAISDLKPCEGTQIQFTDKSSAAQSAISAWRWDFGDGTTAAVQHPAKQYNRFGSYTVLLRVTDQNGCAAESTAGSQATLNVLIKPEMNAGPDLFAEEGEQVILKASASNASQLKFSWTPADLLNNPAILNPVYVALKDQVFTLTATDKEGVCSATDEVTITLLRSVKIPNAFTPNGDGVNDLWDIRNLSNYTQCTVAVFNRYGQKVYFSQGYAKAWDGTQNGSALPSGTYYYVIHLKPNEPPVSGAVTILK
jgi:gliding motility-associated-like protein